MRVLKTWLSTPSCLLPKGSMASAESKEQETEGNVMLKLKRRRVSREEFTYMWSTISFSIEYRNSVKKRQTMQAKATTEVAPP